MVRVARTGDEGRLAFYFDGDNGENVREEEIPEARRRALPGVRRCVSCQEEADQLDRRANLYNRRGSKDSQLR